MSEKIGEFKEEKEKRKYEKRKKEKLRSGLRSEGWKVKGSCFVFFLDLVSFSFFCIVRCFIVGFVCL